MKLQLDTTLKTIKIEESVNIGEFLEILERLLPNELWKEFKLETNQIINWTQPINPIIIEPYKSPYNPPYQPWITYNSNETTPKYKLNEGFYNVKVNF
jgi:hypothetical protein